MADKDYGVEEPEPTDEEIEAMADEAADEARAEMAAKGEQEEGEFEQEKREAEEAGIIVDGKVVDDEVPIAEDDAGASQEELEAELDDMRKGMEDRHVALVGKEGTWPSDHGEPLIADLASQNPLYRTEPTLPLAPPGTEAADVAQLIHRVSVLESLLAGGAEQEYLLAGQGSCTNPQTMLPVDTEATAAQTDTWDRDDQETNDGVVNVELQRMSYDHTAGDPQLYAYYRTVTRDSLGAIMTISAETRVTVDDTEPCP